MQWILILCLGAGNVETTDVPKIEITTGGIYDAPRVSVFPWWELPASEKRDDGVWLPIRLHLAMAAWWTAYEGLPNLFQLQLDELERIEEASFSQGIELGEARERHRDAVASLDEPDGWPDWIVTALYAIGTAAAISAGIVIGWYIRGL